MDAPASAVSKKRRPLALIAVVGLVALLLIVDMRRRSVENQLAQLSMQVQQGDASQSQNQAVAKEVVDKVRKLYDLPAGIEPTVATIVDVDALRKRNVFYDKAKNGDYLVVTADRAILYDAKANMILDVVPVQIQAAAEGASQSSLAVRAR